MDFEGAAPDPDLTEDQRRLIATLLPRHIQNIDQALLSESGRHYRKVAFVVGMAMGKLEHPVVGIPDSYYAQRVAALVSEGKLVSQGDLKRMHSSEVKLP